MTCHRFRPLLRAHVDRELSLGDRLALSVHRWRCPGCAARLRTIRALAESLAGLDDTAPALAEPRAATPVAGAGRLALDVAVALAIGLSAFLATDAALGLRSAIPPSEPAPQSTTMAAVRPPALDTSTRDLRPESGLW